MANSPTDVPEDQETASEGVPGEIIDAEVEESAGIAIEVEGVDSGPTSEALDAGADDPVTQLTAQVATLEQDKKQLHDRYVRSVADLENVRKRSKREISDARVESQSQVLRDILPVVDNLERALEHADVSDGTGGIVEGVKLVMRQFTTALEKWQVKAVDAIGQAFDPNIHEAISQMETADYEPGQVCQVMQRGYTIGDRLLRASLVAVAKAPANGAAKEPSPTASSDAGAGDKESADGESA